MLARAVQRDTNHNRMVRRDEAETFPGNQAMTEALQGVTDDGALTSEAGIAGCRDPAMLSPSNCLWVSPPGLSRSHGSHV